MTRGCITGAPRSVNHTLSQSCSFFIAGGAFIRLARVASASFRGVLRFSLFDRADIGTKGKEWWRGEEREKIVSSLSSPLPPSSTFIAHFPISASSNSEKTSKLATQAAIRWTMTQVTLKLNGLGDITKAQSQDYSKFLKKIKNYLYLILVPGILFFHFSRLYTRAKGK